MYDHVIWPERFHLKILAIYGLNDIDVQAALHIVWKLLVDAENCTVTSRLRAKLDFSAVSGNLPAVPGSPA